MNQPKVQAALAFDLPETQPAQTPMMQQYWALKNAHADCLLFFRMGDFYELFFEDAVKAAPILDVALTRRGKEQGEDVPMCGVPVHAYEAYIPKLIEAGLRVAIAEQMEDPATAKKRGGKALVERQVVRVMTPGTLTEEQFLDARGNSYLAVLVEAQGSMAACWCDLSAGQPVVEEVSDLSAFLGRLQPAELVLSDKLAARADMQEALAAYTDIITKLPHSRFDAANAAQLAAQHYGVGTLDGFGLTTPALGAALGVLIDYMALTQKQKVSMLSRPRLGFGAKAMMIDASTRRNLELAQSLNGERKGSLLSAIDMTCSSAGGRLLAEQLSMPLCDVDAINQRLSRIDAFVETVELRGNLRALLSAAPDMARALTRLSLGRGSPRDLAAIAAALDVAEKMGLAVRGEQRLPQEMRESSQRLNGHDGLIEKLKGALRETLPLLARDGGFIRPGYHAGLDELVSLRDDGKQLIAQLQARYAQETKIPSLRVKHNNVIGFHIELTPSHAEKLLQPPYNQTFIHRQTLISGARFSTTELSELERKLSEAEAKALSLEMQLFDGLVADVLAKYESLRDTANAMAELDVSLGLAQLSAERQWVRPIIDDSLAFEIEAGRHPVVEASLLQSGDRPFTPNNSNLSDGSRLWLVTGPNMAGKSTFLRQNALIAILAQMGSHVPATKAHIGVVDRLFSRVGAADDLARGHSTFMVEMIETALILHQATQKSFVILDEIGRGTATFDGLSIAWAALEYLYHHTQCRGLFATHYHELTALDKQLPALHLAHASVKEWEGKIIFLHAITDGAAESSYGIHVAELAGLPEGVIARAKVLLAELEKKQGGAVVVAPVNAEGFKPIKKTDDALVKALAAIDPDQLSPRDALEAIYRLKKIQIN